MGRRKVTVTGGAGFIGSNLTAELVREGHEVTVVDDLSTGHLENIGRLVDDGEVRFLERSILDRTALLDAFEGAECVFHQAARPSVARSVRDPWATNEVNVSGTLNVLLAARDAGVKRVVMASSSSVYGDTPTLPKREDMTPMPKSPYAVSKLVDEHYCRVFTEVYGLGTTCLRYFNVFGPRQDPASEYAAVIPLFITKALRKEPPIIYGDGTQTRDFTFVRDVVRANILAMERGADGTFNIAGGRQVSVGELADLILDMGGSDVRPVLSPPRQGDVLHSLADISKARERLGYAPEHSLESGLEATFEWFAPERERVAPLQAR